MLYHGEEYYERCGIILENRGIAVGPARTEHDKAALQRQIDTTDKQIDRLVYELYGLTPLLAPLTAGLLAELIDEEIRILEGG